MLLLVALAACGPEAPGPALAPDPVDSAAAVDTSTSPADPPTLESLVTVDGLLAHLDALQAIADAHAGNRGSITEGYAASVDYAEGVLRGAGYTVTRAPFTWTTWIGSGTLEVDGVPADEDELEPLVGSVAGDVTAPIAAVDLVLPPTPQTSSTSGCEATDFDGFPAGAIALVQRGTCTFGTKAALAEAAGAVAVVVFNEGQADRQDVERWVLDPPAGVPVLGTSFAVGEALASASAEVHLVVEVEEREHAAENLIADTPTGDPTRTVVVGAHLDSVAGGPGINDNGSGTALVLELAVQAAASGWAPANRVRFALWGAEEVGLVGSLRWLEGLGADEVDGLLANLNYDMIGSPNGARFVYDGDGSAHDGEGPPGSAVIEDLHADWFAEQGLDWEESPFDGRSDYLGFILRGIPAGGLFSGAEADKSADQAERYGGEADAPYDACYHQPCDTIDNIDPALFLELSLAAAHVTRRLGEWSGPLGAERSAPVQRWTAPVVGVEGCHGERFPRF